MMPNPFSQPAWSPDLVYTHQPPIQPYNDEQFLTQIFNYN